MTREERAAWLEEWADECQRKGGNSIRDGDTRLAEFWQKRGAFLRLLAATYREPDGWLLVYGGTEVIVATDPDEYADHCDAILYLDSLEADNED